MKEVINIAIDKIIVNNENPRSNVGDVSDLVASIKEFGLFNPLTVRSVYQDDVTRYELVAGHRRLQALKILKQATATAIVVEAKGIKAFEIATSENLVRVNMSPVDEAKAISKMVEQGRSKHEIAAIFGQKPRWVEGRVKILKLGDNALKMLEDGEMNLGHAEILCMADSSDVDDLLDCIADGLTPEQLKAHIMEQKKSLENAPFDSRKLCNKCPMRSDCQADLFGDVKGSFCLDKECYQNKVKSYIEERIEYYKSKGYEGVPECQVWRAKSSLNANEYRSYLFDDYIPVDCIFEEVQETLEEMKEYNVKPRYVVNNDDKVKLVYSIEDLRALKPEESENEDEEEIEESNRNNDYTIKRKAETMMGEALNKKVLEHIVNLDSSLIAMLIDAFGDWQTHYEVTEANADGEVVEIEEPFVLHENELYTRNVETPRTHAELLAEMITEGIVASEFCDKICEKIGIESIEEFKKKASEEVE